MISAPGGSRTPGLRTPAAGGDRRDPHGRVASRSFPDARAAGKSDGARVDVHVGGWDLPTLSEDRLRDGSPSRLAGMSVANETRCREQACELLRVVARRLRLPLPPTVAALTILLRFYQRRAHDECSAQFVVPTCLYVASKLEEVPRRISDIVNVTHRVLYPWRGDVVELLRVLPPSRSIPRRQNRRRRRMRSAAGSSRTFTCASRTSGGGAVRQGHARPGRASKSRQSHRGNGHDYVGRGRGRGTIVGWAK